MNTTPAQFNDERNRVWRLELNYSLARRLRDAGVIITPKLMILLKSDTFSSWQETPSSAAAAATISAS